MDRIERLQELGVDTVHSLERFGNNQPLYERFLCRFPSDPNFSDLQAALAQRDYQSALGHAHTLKGLSANLGMDRLSADCAELVARLRGGETEGLSALMEALEQDYERIVAAVKGE